jgi:hypothetical protein
MTNPEIGVWLGDNGEIGAPDPSNPRRICGNNPTNMVDPTGLFETPTFSGAGRGPNRNDKVWNTTVPGFKAKVELRDFDNDAREKEMLDALQKAAVRVNNALAALGGNEWDKYSKFKTIPVAGVDKPIESKRYAQIDKYRWLYHDRLAKVWNRLMDPKTTIVVYSTRWTHPDKNPMYTSSSIFDINYADYIATRVHFWDLSADTQAYWTCHELARYFLFLGDDSDYSNGQGVQQWDEVIDWLLARQEQLESGK